MRTASGNRRLPWRDSGIGSAGTSLSRAASAMLFGAGRTLADDIDDLSDGTGTGTKTMVDDRQGGRPRTPDGCAAESPS